MVVIYYLLGSFIKLAFLLDLLLVALQILDHEILTSQLEVISVMVDALSRCQMEIVKHFIDGVSLDPKDVPVLTTN